MASLKILERVGIDVHDVGFVDSGMQGSLPVVAICNDLIGWLRAATAGVVVNAAQQVDQVLTGHQLAYLPPDVQRDAKRIVERKQEQSKWEKK